MAGVGLYDLVFDPDGTAGVGPLGVMLHRETKTVKVKGDIEKVVILPAKVEGGFAAAEADDPTTIQTVPEIQSDFSGGALYSKRVIANGYARGAPAYCRSPKGVTPPGAETETDLPSPSPALGSITDSFQFSEAGDRYFLAGRYVLVSEDGSSNTLTIAQDLGSGFVADGVALFNGDAYIGGSGGNIWKCTSAGVFSQSADVSHRKAGVVTWLIPSEGLMRARLVMADSTLKGVRYTGGDPMVLANWTPNPTFISVGDSSYLITNIAAAPNHFYILKEDGVHDLNSRGETVNLTPDFRRQPIGSDNGAATLYYDNHLHVSHVNGAHRVDVSSSRRRYGAVWTLPVVGVVNETPIVGPVTAWTIDQGWIVASVYNESTGISYIGAGRNRYEEGVPDGPGPILWHFAEAEVTGRVTGLWTAIVDGLPRLWIASRQGANTRLSWRYLPNATNPVGELENATDFQFDTSMRLYTTAYDWGDPDSVKILRVIGLRGDNLGVTAGVALSANAEGGDFTLQATARTSPRSRISPRAPLTEGHEIGALMVGIGSATIPPVVRALKLDAELQTEQFDRRRYPFKVGKQQSLRDGTLDGRSGAQTFDAVTELHTAGVMELRDNIEKATLNVRVHPISSYTATEDSNTDEYTYVGVLPVTVLDILTGSAGQGVIWGSGAIWGAGEVWGAA